MRDNPEFRALLDRAKQLTAVEQATAFLLFLGRLTFHESLGPRTAADLLAKALDDVAHP